MRGDVGRRDRGIHRRTSRRSAALARPRVAASDRSGASVYATGAMFFTVHMHFDPPRVRPRAELEKSPDVVVAIGDAPDGLPLVLDIGRSRNVRSALLSVLGSR